MRSPSCNSPAAVAATRSPALSPSATSNRRPCSSSLCPAGRIWRSLTRFPIDQENLVHAIAVVHGRLGNGDRFFFFFAGDRCLHKETGFEACVMILDDRLGFKGARVLRDGGVDAGDPALKQVCRKSFYMQVDQCSIFDPSRPSAREPPAAPADGRSAPAP